MEHTSTDDDDSLADKECVLPTSPAEPEKYKSPKRLMRTCTASLDDSTAFGKMVAAEAHREGFFKAKRQAFGGRNEVQLDDVEDPLSELRANRGLHSRDQLSVQGGGGDRPVGGFRLGLCARMDSCVLAGRVDDVLSELQHWLDTQPPAPPTLRTMILAKSCVWRSAI
ncbi:MAG: hypothetical protein R3C59_08470 [Planctomycetaceae bacterium]